MGGSVAEMVPRSEGTFLVSSTGTEKREIREEREWHDGTP